MSHELLVVVGGDEDTLFDLMLDRDLEADEGDGAEGDGDGAPHVDWYVLGGRWSGWFRLREGAAGRLGERGVGDPRPDEHPTLVGRADSALLRDVDVEGMRAEAAATAGARWDAWHAAVDGLPADRTWAQLHEQVVAEVTGRRRGLFRRAGPTPDELRRETTRRFAAQPRQAALRAALDDVDGLGQVAGLTPDDLTPEDLGRDDYVEHARLSALTGAHLLRGGVWDERPYVSLDGPAAVLAWLREHGRWPDEVPPDTVVTAVDVHR